MFRTTTDFDLAGLRERMAGDVVTAESPDWDQARQAYNLAADQRPLFVALPQTSDDVIAIMDFAREHGVPVAPQATGHNAMPLGALEDAILLRTDRMRHVEVDPGKRVARVQAGAKWMHVIEAAKEHGLATLAGSSDDVSVVGYSLGGGLSFIGRKYGLATNHVVAIELVTVDGRLVRTDAGNEPELFWALRGGGGNFGVVTAVEIGLLPITEIYAGMLVYDWERSAEVLHTWNRMLPSMPDDMTLIARIMQIPPIPDIPEPLQGRQLVIVEAIYDGDPAEGARLIEPLTSLGPEIDTMATIPMDTLRYLHMDPPDPVPALSDHMILERLPDEAIDAIVAVAGPGSGSPLLMFEMRQIGGAVARRQPGSGVTGSFPGSVMTFAAGMPMEPAMAAAIEDHLPLVRAALEAWDARAEYLNFAENARSADTFFPEESLRRLRDVKAQYDPDELLRSNHPIPPAG